MTEFKDFALGIPRFHFSDLYAPLKLKELHEEFWLFVSKVSPDLKTRFDSIPSGGLTLPQESEVLIEVAKQLGDFIGRLFNVSSQAAKLKSETEKLSAVFRFKKEFLNIRVFRRFEEVTASSEVFREIEEKVSRICSHEPNFTSLEDEQKFAEVALFFVDLEKKLKKEPLSAAEGQKLNNLCSHIAGAPLEKVDISLKAFEEYCTQVWIDEERRKRVINWLSFVRPQKLDFENLVPTVSASSDLPEKKVLEECRLHPRDGFKLTDPRMSQKQALREVDYCIYCHQRDKDSCQKGFPEKTGGMKKNPLGVSLEGCPLDERISEMHFLRKQGDVIASLAMVMLDNPMCPGTGHRICNDCMRSCIFQKQDPVNIPQTETRVLTDVLEMPYGFEIYSLLTRFNPLNRRRPYALPYNGKNVLIVGLGPAGYTLSHYLSNEGFGVVGVDALKLEPLEPILTGRGKTHPKPIYSFQDLKKELDERVLTGFGGVSEYGITVRWDKNFLSVIYLALARRSNLRFLGGVRFGGTFTLEDSWARGFDHVALATGAGKPTIIDMENNLIRGIRKASDFLMALQLGGAFKKGALANLQVRLPAIVIGGGLTGVDTSTELLAYYPVQVEKVLEKFEILSKQFGEDSVWKLYDGEEKEVLEEFIAHAKVLRKERDVARKENRKPNFIPLLREWGGVTLVYRKKISDSPAYRLNFEEVEMAMEEGIAFAENLSPVKAMPDKYGAVSALQFKRLDGSVVSLPARSVCVAAGTSPNTIYEKEYPGTFSFDEKNSYFQKHKAILEGGKVTLEKVKGPSKSAFFTSYENEGRLVSFYGDNHSDYAGNVVKAMASAKHGSPFVAELFSPAIQAAEAGQGPALSLFTEFAAELEKDLSPKVVKVERLTPTIVEVVVKGKYVAEKFQPGQFYRLQNFETNSHSIDGQKLVAEGLALTGAWVDVEKELLSMIVLEMGGSSRLCSILKPGEPVVVMGPTGTPTEIPREKNVVLVGGGLGNAVLLSVGKALKAAGSRVLYFAGYKKEEDVFRPQDIEDITHQIVWAVDSGKVKARRKQDKEFTGNIVQAMVSFAKGELGNDQLFDLKDADHLIVIGSDRMMAAVSESRHAVLKPFLNPHHEAVASINSPMQCMMKEVCAQCLQRHMDPVTKKETFVFSCNFQDQKMDWVDFSNLNQRLKTNSLVEKLSNRYLDYLFQRGNIERV